MTVRLNITNGRDWRTMGVSLKRGDLVATGGIVWEVIATNTESSLLITKDIVARLPYYLNRDENCRGYIDSVIRSWLNEAFLYSLPSEFTKRMVKTKLVNTEKLEGFDYAKYGIEEEESFEDKVFLLTDAEARVLFKNDSSRRARFNLDYLRCAEPRAYVALSDAERNSVWSCDDWYLRTLDPDKHYLVTGYGEIEACQPSSINGYYLRDLDSEMYESMDTSLGETLLHLRALSMGIVGVRAPLAASMIKGEIGLGIRPATWIENEN